jgi:Tol biopolymer transport system component/imidazolonepropionase-like amidohydrolase
MRITVTTGAGRVRDRLIVTVAALAACGSWLVGQSPARDVRLTLREGTSMAAALSPDGKTIAIDFLGALWTLGIDGGAARRILEDGYDARLPAWSPDGTRLAFQAYLRDTWHIWAISADGTGLQELTSGPYDDREPHWSPDGTRLAFSSDRGGNYDIWILTIATGEVRRLTTHAANDSMPAWSPDGREIAFVSDRPELGVYARALEAGSERLLVADRAAVWSPSWTPDGKTVAYVSVEGPASRLMLGGTAVSESGEDVFPFRPQWGSSGDLLYTADGVIKRRPRSGGAASTVPFAAEIAFTRAAFTPKARNFTPDGPQPARGLMHPVISPDGSRVAFAALGDLWTVSAAGGDAIPERITRDAFVEMNPVWSPQGTELAFSSDRGGAMDLWVRDLRTGQDRRVAGGAEKAAWSPDGTRLAFLDMASQLRVVDVKTLEGRQVHERLNEPGRPSWSPDGRAVVMSALRPYSSRFREGTNQVLWVQVDPNPSATGRDAFAPDRWFDPSPHKSIGMRENLGPVWSPDGRQMAAIIDGYLHAFPVSRDGAPTGPPRRLSADLASSPSWTADSRQILYQGLDRFRVVNLDDGRVRDIVPRVAWDARKASGTITVHGGRVFDGRGAGARDAIDIVVDGNRIQQVEPHRDELHRGVVVDASGQTVLPGLIESHTHLSKAYGEALGRIWLSFGITTIRNPATNPFEGNEDREAIDSGARIGPRVVTTGEPLDGTRIYYPGGVALDSGALVDSFMSRAQALGFDFIKTYVRLPDLIQKRVIEAAHQAGMPVTSHEIYPAVAFGADGVEHIRGTSRRGFSPKMSETRRSYRDVIDLLAASGMTITPTIGIQGGHQVLTLGDGAWLDDVRIARLFPPSAAEPSRALRAKPQTPQDLAAREALVTVQERTAAAVVRAGGRVIAGTDSPINPYALSLLLELEHFVRGGLSPADAIRSATAVPAEAMGLGAELGTIEPGKLADLIVIDGDPLANIADLRRTRRVIKDGVLYELEALLARPAPLSSAGGRP